MAFRLTAGDTVVIAVALFAIGAAFVALWRPATAAQHLHVRVGGESRLVLPLNSDGRHTISAPGGQSVIEIRERRARFLQSSCTHGYCVNYGWIETGGDFIACLPNGISIEIGGVSEAYDGLSF